MQEIFAHERRKVPRGACHFQIDESAWKSWRPWAIWFASITVQTLSESFSARKTNASLGGTIFTAADIPADHRTPHLYEHG